MSPAAARYAYVPEFSLGISIIDTATNAKLPGTVCRGCAILATAIAISPDGSRAYVSNPQDGVVQPIDTTSNDPMESIAVGDAPRGIAVAPDGKRVYVTTDHDDRVSVIDTTTDTKLGDVAVGEHPIAIALTPDGSRAYVVNMDDDDVSVIDTATSTKVGPDIPVGDFPVAIAITPDGSHAYVTSAFDEDVSVIDTATNTKLGDIALAGSALAIAISPDGSRAYAYRTVGGTLDVPGVLSVIETATNEVIAEIPVGRGNPLAGAYMIAVSPDAGTVYVVNALDWDVSVVDTATNTNLGIDIPVGEVGDSQSYPLSIAIIPNQPPVASFTESTNPTVGSPVTFDASSSSDSDGHVARYDWDFGDGTELADGGATPTHTYAHPGSHAVTVTAIDNEGCSTRFIFTGQTAYCNGSGVAAKTKTIMVSDSPAKPETKVDCKNGGWRRFDFRNQGGCVAFVQRGR